MKNFGIIGADTARPVPKINTVTCGDCLDIMPLIPDKSIDMVLCDLPYGTTRNKWDCVINLPDLWRSIWRVCKSNSAVVLFSSQPFTTTLISSQLQHYKYEWVWVKNLKTGNLNARFMPMGGHETLQIFYKAKPTYNPQKRKRTVEIKAGNKKNSKTSNYGTQRELYLDRQGDYINPDTVLCRFKCVHNSSGKVHPTQKPVDLCEYLVRTYTNEGDTVLDMAIGSGTTAVACINTGRNYIGIERDEKYYKIAEKRTSCAKKSAQDNKEVFHTSPNCGKPK